jgi:hypothetical protein
MEVQVEVLGNNDAGALAHLAWHGLVEKARKALPICWTAPPAMAAAWRAGMQASRQAASPAAARCSSLVVRVGVSRSYVCNEGHSHSCKRLQGAADPRVNCRQKCPTKRSVRYTPGMRTGR